MKQEASQAGRASHERTKCQPIARAVGKRRGSYRLKILRWHRQIGLAAAAFITLLATTGIILNHTASLELNSSFISNKWLLGWYDIDAKQVADGYIAPLSADRVLLDLHTGRFFGEYGWLIMDISAIILLLLTITGIYNWYRSPRRSSK